MCFGTGMTRARFFFFSSRRRHTRWPRDWSSDVCSSDLVPEEFETSVEIFSRVLTRYLVPRDEIDRQIRSIRQDAYETFRTMSEEHTTATGLNRFLGDLSLEVYRVQPGSPVVGKALESSGIRDA